MSPFGVKWELEMVDRTLIIRKMALISEDLEEVQALAKLTVEEYKGDRINEVVAERYLERMIGRMIDVNYHIATEEGKPPPRDYYQSFVDLAEIGVMPRDFAEKIAPCAGLRNRIVHEYDVIDSEKVYEGLKAAANDIPRYLKYINDFIH